MEIITIDGREYLAMHCPSVSEALGRVPKGSTPPVRFPVTGYIEDEAGRRVPVLGIKMPEEQPGKYNRAHLK